MSPLCDRKTSSLACECHAKGATRRQFGFCGHGLVLLSKSVTPSALDLLLWKSLDLRLEGDHVLRPEKDVLAYGCEHVSDCTGEREISVVS